MNPKQLKTACKNILKTESEFMNNFEIRESFLKFFQQREHKVLLSSALVLNDPTLLFTNAGMNQFKNVFLGIEKAPAKNVVTIQRCLRAGGKHNDLEMVGETPLHHTFFEMMGNFSFGGYFKKEAIALAWEFLTKELKLPAEHLWVSVHKKDEESYAIWRDEQKIPENKIYREGDKDNFWQMGKIGPCGYCSEIHYYTGEEERPDPKHFMEIWNLVFMEFNDTSEGQREKLKTPCVDTGMGLERLCAILNNKKNNYHTELFSKVISSLEKASDFKYDFNENTKTDQQKAFRVLADHSRAVSFLINENIFPGSVKAEYVLRRIMRRAFYYAQKLQSKKNLLWEGAKEVIELMSHPPSQSSLRAEELGYQPSLLLEKENIKYHIEQEASQFNEILKEGQQRLEQVIQFKEKKPPSVEKKLADYEVWDLYSSYGLPMDVTRLMAKERGWQTPTEEEMEQYKNKLAEKGSQYVADHTFEQDTTDPKWEKVKKQILENHQRVQNKQKTIYTAYEKNKEEGKITKVISLKSSSAEFSAEDSPILQKPVSSEVDNTVVKQGSPGYVDLDKTCFYPEGGGPIGDKGWLKSKGRIIADVLDCQKKGDSISHEVRARENLSPGQTCEMEVDTEFREGIKTAHTSTHLLNAALREVLGSSVQGGIKQAGSLVEPYRLRFDFTFPRPLSKKEIAQVQNKVLESVWSKEKVSSEIKSFDQAEKEGALFLKTEKKYGEQVRVLTIGKKTSKELCGGIHVQNTKEIENFKIILETGVQAGVRRIIAYTGTLIKIWEELLLQQNLELRKLLDISSLDVSNTLKQKSKDNLWNIQIEQQNPFLQWVEENQKELKTLRKKMVCLEEDSSPKKSWKKTSVNLKKEPVEKSLVKKSKASDYFHPLAQQNLDLREQLKIALPKEKNMNPYFNKKIQSAQSPNEGSSLGLDFFKEQAESPLLKFFKNKKEEVQQLKNGIEKLKQQGLTKEALVKQAKEFQIKSIKGHLLVAQIPLEDRKILSDLSDFLLSQLSSGVLIFIGEGQESYPVLVNISKNLTELLSAGELLKKTIVPLCGGKGGGKASFAQGSINNKEKFLELEKLLLDTLK